MKTFNQSIKILSQSNRMSRTLSLLRLKGRFSLTAPIKNPSLCKKPS